MTFYREPAPPITVGQSIGLLRYIAQLRTPEAPHNLYPSEDKMNCLLIDEILYADEDMISIAKAAFIEQDQDKKLRMTKGNNITIFIHSLGAFPIIGCAIPAV